VNRLEGANCADLPGFVIDKYLDCNVGTERFYANVARAICDHCIVQPDCRDQALNMPGLQKRGIIGGVSAMEIHHARRWRAYESGITDQVPRCARPDWLGRPEAVEMVEQLRVEVDPDEPSVER